MQIGTALSYGNSGELITVRFKDGSIQQVKAGNVINSSQVFVAEGYCWSLTSPVEQTSNTTTTRVRSRLDQRTVEYCAAYLYYEYIQDGIRRDFLTADSYIYDYRYHQIYRRYIGVGSTTYQRDIPSENIEDATNISFFIQDPYTEGLEHQALERFTTSIQSSVINDSLNPYNFFNWDGQPPFSETQLANSFTSFLDSLTTTRFANINTNTPVLFPDTATYIINSRLNLNFTWLYAYIEADHLFSINIEYNPLTRKATAGVFIEPKPLDNLDLFVNPLRASYVAGGYTPPELLPLNPQRPECLSSNLNVSGVLRYNLKHFNALSDNGNFFGISQANIYGTPNFITLPEETELVQSGVGFISGAALKNGDLSLQINASGGLPPFEIDFMHRSIVAGCLQIKPYRLIGWYAESTFLSAGIHRMMNDVEFVETTGKIEINLQIPQAEEPIKLLELSIGEDIQGLISHKENQEGVDFEIGIIVGIVNYIKCFVSVENENENENPIIPQLEYFNYNERPVTPFDNWLKIYHNYSREQRNYTHAALDLSDPDNLIMASTVPYWQAPRGSYRFYAFYHPQLVSRAMNTFCLIWLEENTITYFDIADLRDKDMTPFEKDTDNFILLFFRHTAYNYSSILEALKHSNQINPRAWQVKKLSSQQQIPGQKIKYSKPKPYKATFPPLIVKDPNNVIQIAAIIPVLRKKIRKQNFNKTPPVEPIYPVIILGD